MQGGHAIAVRGADIRALVEKSPDCGAIGGLCGIGYGRVGLRAMERHREYQRAERGDRCDR